MAVFFTIDREFSFCQFVFELLIFWREFLGTIGFVHALHEFWIDQESILGRGLAPVVSILDILVATKRFNLLGKHLESNALVLFVHTPLDTSSLKRKPEVDIVGQA